MYCSTKISFISRSFFFSILFFFSRGIKTQCRIATIDSRGQGKSFLIFFFKQYFFLLCQEKTFFFHQRRWRIEKYFLNRVLRER